MRDMRAGVTWEAAFWASREPVGSGFVWGVVGSCFLGDFGWRVFSEVTISFWCICICICICTCICICICNSLYCR